MIIIEQLRKRNLWMKSRDKDGKVIIKIDETFHPYFYNDKKEKIVVDSPGDVVEARKEFKRHYEADVIYPQRYMIDKLEIPIKKEPIRICYFDIETDKCLDKENVPKPVISIVCFDSFFKRFIAFQWRKDLKNEKLKKQVIIKEYNFDEMVPVYRFNTEEAFLNKFISFIESTDPDILAGFNSGGKSKYKYQYDPYDIPYLIHRMRKLKINDRKLSPLRFTKIDMKNRNYVIKGRVLFDIMEGYKKLKTAVRYSLDYVAETELGLNKVEMDKDKMWEDMDALLKYNVADVYLTKEIDKKLHMIEAFNILRRITGCDWGGLFYESFVADAPILREAKRRGIVLKTREKRAKERLEGAYVMKVIPGLHKNVVVLDLKSLYPSLMCQFNISFDTIKDKYEKGDVKLGNGIIFDQQEEGIVPTVLKDLFILRDSYKEKKKKYERHTPEWETYDTLQFATKINMNAFYGQFGNARSRIYEPRAAGSITWLGREVIKWTMKIIEDSNNKVIYADTDSVFIEFEKMPSIEEVNIFLEKINKSYVNFVAQFGGTTNSYLSLDFQEIYKTISFTKAKKRYIGWLINDGTQFIEPELKVRGFEIRRKDQSDFIRDFQTKIFKMVLDEKEKTDIDKYVMKMRSDIKKVKDLNKIAISKRIAMEISDYKKKTALINGVKFANAHLGEDFKAGSEMNFLYCHSVKINGKWMQTSSICWKNNMPEEIEVDWVKMTTLTIDNKASKIYDAMGWNPDIGNTDLEEWIV